MSYYTSLYKNALPAGIGGRSDVAAIQQQLNAQGANLKVDGIWGPLTNAAYAQLGNAGFSTAGPDYYSTDLQALYQHALNTLQTPSISYDMPSRGALSAENAAILRPQYDRAIEQRGKQTLTNRAEIDVDAYSRSMGRSTYVTDVKARAMDSEAADIARMEDAYAVALAAAVQEQYEQHLANKLAADQFNAQAQLAAQQSAFDYAAGLQKTNLALALEQAAAAASASSKGRSGSSKKSSSFSAAAMADMKREGQMLYAAARGNLNALQSTLSNILKNNTAYDLAPSKPIKYRPTNSKPEQPSST